MRDRIGGPRERERERERERVADGDCRVCETEVRTTYREGRTTGVRELSVVC